MGEHVVIGGSGFVGSVLVARLAAASESVTVVDRFPPRPPDANGIPKNVTWLPADLLVDTPTLPPGRVYLTAGTSLPRPRRPWTLVLDNAVATARLASLLTGRHVVALSSIEVYGSAPGPLREDTTPRLPAGRDRVESWCQRALGEANQPCPPWRSFPLCRSLANMDTNGRWLYGLSKWAQELLLEQIVGQDNLTILRAANIFGEGQARVLSRLVHAAIVGAPIRITRGTTRTFVEVERVADALAAPLGSGVFNVGGQQMPLDELAGLVGEEVGRVCEMTFSDQPADDSCGIAEDGRLRQRIGDEAPLDGQLRRVVRSMLSSEAALFVPPLPVVVPPRPERPDLVADRQQAALWSGVVKYGGPWTIRLEDRLREVLGLDGSHRVVATASGTAALRMAIHATAGPARPGAVALVPSFTFAATGEALRQLGYRLHFVDVDPDYWTLDPAALDDALEHHGGDVVVCVDSLGHPADYDALRTICSRRGVRLVGDSAPSLGASYRGQAVGTQADAHAFSMSFAKLISAGGAGGAVVVPSGTDLEGTVNWFRSGLLHELHAVVALDLLTVVDELVARRREIAAIYNAAASRWPGVVPQQVRADSGHAYVHWVARFAGAEGLDCARVGDALDRLGVQTKRYYAPVLHHLEGADATLSSLPITEQLASEALALPMSSEMTTDDADRVVVALDRLLLRDPPRERRPGHLVTEIAAGATAGAAVRE